MRDYVLETARSRRAFGVWALLGRVVRNRKHHRELALLLHLDDYLLRDMGLSRDLIQHLLALPLSTEVDWERERILRQR
jgi:uncharacterized protein YjiS (DUF1127 family)